MQGQVSQDHSEDSEEDQKAVPGQRSKRFEG